MIARRAKVEMVAHLVMIPKDQWDQFSAPLFMRRNLKMIRKLLTTAKHWRINMYT